MEDKLTNHGTVSAAPGGGDTHAWIADVILHHLSFLVLHLLLFHLLLILVLPPHPLFLLVFPLLLTDHQFTFIFLSHL